MNSVATPTNEHASGDDRFLRLDAEIAQRECAQHALIEILHLAQKIFGSLDVDLLYYVAHKLMLPASRVYGVATFYHMFLLRPQGQHDCLVCMGTACYIKGGAKLLAKAEELTQIRAGMTMPDGRVSLTTARCIGACGLAPLTIDDGLVNGHQSVDLIQDRMHDWLDHASK